MNRQHVSKFVGVLVAVGLVGMTVPVNAQTVTPFQMVGHIQSFVLDPIIGTACPASNIGARMIVNGTEVIIPCHSVILLPAAYKTPLQLFDEAKGISKDQGQSGLALQDTTHPSAAFEVSIDGNIVCTPGCLYIAGQVHISQQSLNAGAGFIKAIDSATGEMRVGADPTAPITSTDARIHINDPEVDFGGGKKTGRYGLSNKQQFPAPLPNTNPHSRYPDDRFQVDQDNPTIHALTGYPMCLPRPIAGGDPDCPLTNRTNANDGTGRLQKVFVMTGPNIPGTPGLPEIKVCNPVCDPMRQAPMMVGDYIIYQGTMASYPDQTDPTKSIAYISAHTIEVNLGIYTEAGKNPAYVSVEPILIGTKGDETICEGGPAECQDRIKVEGFTTDPTRSVNIYAVDITPNGTGGFTSSLRLIAPGATKPAPFGRFRFTADKNAGVLVDRTGALRGATRELIARIESNAGILPGESKPLNDLPLFANGLQAGQYQAPIGEYIYPEPHDMGGSLPPLNFQCLSFLARGWDLDGLILKRLDPWPGFNDAQSDARFFSCSL